MATGRPIGASSDFARQLAGFSLTTVEIHYHLPDYPRLLQMFAFQQYDEAPGFPELRRYLDWWTREIEGKLHSVRVANRRLIGPQEWRAVDGVISIH